MPVNEIVNPKNISLFIGIASLIWMIVLFLNDRRKLTAKRLVALSVTCLLGFAYFFSQP